MRDIGVKRVTRRVENVCRDSVIRSMGHVRRALMAIGEANAHRLAAPDAKVNVTKRMGHVHRVPKIILDISVIRYVILDVK